MKRGQDCSLVGRWGEVSLKGLSRVSDEGILE